MTHHAHTLVELLEAWQEALLWLAIGLIWAISRIGRKELP